MSDSVVEVKTLLVGDIGVGKSSALLRYADDTFTPGATGAATFKNGTIFKGKTVTKGEHELNLKIWDKAEPEKFRSMVAAWYRDAGIVLLCFDASGKAHTTGSDDTSTAVINYLQKYRDEIEKHCSTYVGVVVCGLRNDSSSNTDVVGAAKEFAEKYNYRFSTSSAKDNQGIQEMFAEGVDGYLEAKEREAKAEAEAKAKAKAKAEAEANNNLAGDEENAENTA